MELLPALVSRDESEQLLLMQPDERYYIDLGGVVLKYQRLEYSSGDALAHGGSPPIKYVQEHLAKGKRHAQVLRN
jgi:hypothetical protein